MSHECEYRRESMQQNVYTLYINGKPAKMNIFGMSMWKVPLPDGSSAQMPTLWFADGGSPEKNKVRQYPSLEAAFQGEKEFLQRLSQTGDFKALLESGSV